MSTSKSVKEQAVVVNKEAVQVDTAKMSVEQMVKLRDALDAEIASKASRMFDETITLVNEKLKSMRRTKTDAVMGLIELMEADEKASLLARFKLGRTPGVAAAARKGGAGKKDQPFVRGTTYVSPKPEDGEWVAGSKGAKPKWLAQQMEGLSFEDAKKKYESLAKK